MAVDSIELKVEDLVRNTTAVDMDFGAGIDAASSIERNFNNDSMSMSVVRDEQQPNQSSDSRIAGLTRIQGVQEVAGSSNTTDGHHH
jgi:hypothetical protein